MERWKQYELGIFWFCIINFILAAYLCIQQGLNYECAVPLGVQYLSLVGLAFFLFKQRKYKKPKEAPILELTEYENPLNLKSHEKIHEQKRHYQVAIALIELGEKEQAVAYIDTILQEIS